MDAFPTGDNSRHDRMQDHHSHVSAESYGDAIPDAEFGSVCPDPCKTVPFVDLSLTHREEFCFDEYGENAGLLKSFDMIFGLLQRSEEIRSHLEKIDHILLDSRTVATLIRRVGRFLQDRLDLAAVRVLLREDHPITLALGCAPPPEIRAVSANFVESEGLSLGDPFVLNDPSGDLAGTLFGDAASRVCSAAVAALEVDGAELGLLCLGSDDPDRYCGDTNTELVASLAEKLSRGIKNAWDHESRACQALMGTVEGTYTEAVFLEFLRKEFNRAWRNHERFCIMALSCGAHANGEGDMPHGLAELLLKNVRSADTLGCAEQGKFWILLPDTDVCGAETLAWRLAGLTDHHYGNQVSLHVGITGFSRNATVVSSLIRNAIDALEEAERRTHSGVVVRDVCLCCD